MENQVTSGGQGMNSSREPGKLRALVGNRVTEKDIRDHLDRHGFDGGSARFRELELHAIRRPGWQQVFRFRCAVTDDRGARHQLFGAVYDDERQRTDIWYGLSASERDEKLAEWSAEMIRCEPTTRNVVHWVLLGLFGIALLVALTGFVLRQWAAQ